MTPLPTAAGLARFGVREMRDKARWVGFDVQQVAADCRKTPLIADTPSRKASSTAPETWRTFKTAIDGVKGGRFNAIGYALGDGICGLDLDGGRWVDDEREPTGEAALILERCGSYAERSIRRGLHVLMRGSGGRAWKHDGVEFYFGGRFFIVTGDALADCANELKENPAALRWLRQNYGKPEVATQEYTERAEYTENTRVHREHKQLRVCSCVASLRDAIAQTLPPGPGNRNRYVFRFAQLLKGMYAYRALQPSDRLLKDAILAWHKAALPFIDTADWETTYDDFCYCWPRVKFAAGGGLQSILVRAESIELPGWAAEYSDTSKALIRASIALQRNAGLKPFFLGCRDAGRLAGMDHVDAARRLKRFIDEGILELVKAGVRPKASSYRYLGKPK